MRIIWFLASMVVCSTAATLIKQPSVNTSGKIRYDNYKVYTLKIKNKLKLAIMDYFQAKSDKYNIWKDYDEATNEIHVMINPEEVSHFQRIIKFNGLESKLMINNVQKLIDEESNIPRARADNNEFGWTRYYQLHEIEQWLDLILNTYANVTESFVIGQSYDGRDIRGIKISYKSGNPTIFIESNVHAREWITSATATWFINQLLTSADKKVRNLAENYDWHIIPVYNVDGFVYSHERNRLWRKNRQPVKSSNCIGADINRNFKFHWLENNGASSNPCDETFAGTDAVSTPEAKALVNYIMKIKDKINIYLSFHSYGQVLLSPFGHSKTEFPENYDDMQAVGNAFYNAIVSLPYKTKYRYGSTASVLYVATGSTVDWAVNATSAKLGYTIEYRDNGRYGFVLPPTQILPNCEELMAGMIALVGKAKELHYV